jgi:hypothetical protein
MYIGGATSIKKTHIVKTLKHSFQESQANHHLKVGAYTANAAIIIAGSTLHSL